MTRTPVVIRLSVHGNIGTGKTTMMQAAEKLFAEDADVAVVCVYEPCEAWSSSGMLPMVIHDPARWGVSVQYGMLVTRCTRAAQDEMTKVQPLVQRATHRVVVVLYERSPLDDREIFARHAITTRKDRKLYEQLTARCDTTQFDQIRRMIYLRTSVGNCMNRIDVRKREGEDGYNTEWIEELDRRHESMIELAEASGANVQRIDFFDGADNDTRLIRDIIQSAVDIFAPDQ